MRSSSIARVQINEKIVLGGSLVVKDSNVAKKFLKNSLYYEKFVFSNSASFVGFCLFLNFPDLVEVLKQKKIYFFK